MRQRSESELIEGICAKCDFRFTKPGCVPAYIAMVATNAYRMEALFEAGAGSPYPEVFTPLEWEAFLTLKYARAKDDEKRLAPKPNAPTQESEQARLQALLDSRKRGG